MSIHNLCFKQKFETYQNFLSENFPSLVVKFSIYLNRCVFVMLCTQTFYFINKAPLGSFLSIYNVVALKTRSKSPKSNHFFPPY